MRIPIQNLTRLQWLDERRKGIGGSDTAPVLGQEIARLQANGFPYTSRVGVYFSKVDPVDDKPAGEPARWGTLNEPTIRTEYGERFGFDVREFPFTGVGANPWERGNIDGLCSTIAACYNTAGEILTGHGLEIKTADRFCRKDWGEPGTDEIPDYYMCQVFWYMGIFPELDIFHVPVLFGGNKLEVYFVERDDEAISDIQAICGEFWQKYVIPREPPPPENSQDCLQLWKADTSAMFPASDKIVELCQKRKEADEAFKKANKEKDDISEALKMAIGQADGVTVGDKPIATWKPQKTKRIDVKKLRDEKPEIAKEYEKTTISRVLRVK